MLSSTVTRETFEKTVGRSTYYRMIDKCKGRAFAAIVIGAIALRLLILIFSVVGGNLQ